MKKISIVQNDKPKVINMVRYFQYQKSKILLYTESDFEKDIISVNAAKIAQKLGFIKLVGFNKYDLLNTKSLIKLIIKELSKGNIKSVQDLDPKELTGIKVESFNTIDISLNDFKILVNDPSSLESIDQTMMKIKPFVPVEKNYKELYEASEKENKSNKELIKALMEELKKYRNKYGNLD